ncbi:DJ-1/PfpI family protein [Ferrovibrio sp.]|uniref:DJ-1/PfpI family protein n=1 Tax=Ferrovibrio sp. TaxID=1917215 RepID=UPI000CB88619|nr:DJ-1/PfpI family protein [Ferrovibrio sp.]PJI43210.1 MAG: thiamine biosynthesis protein ThiJ [Ferrovibrio sp.]
MSLQIGFVLFPNLTQLDLTGPWEVFSKLPGATCHLLAPTLEPVKSSSAGLTILPTTTYADCPQLDIVCVPGGPGHLQAMEDTATLDFLKQQAPGCRYVTAVCTGALVLAAAGLLQGYRATTHWMSLERLAAFGAIPIAERVVTDRNRVTGGGVTAGIDFGLVLVQALAGEQIAREIQLQIEYEPQPPYGGSPVTANPATVASLRGKLGSYAILMQEVDTRAVTRLKG